MFVLYIFNKNKFVDTLILKLAMVKIFKVPTYTTHKEKKNPEYPEYTPSIPRVYPDLN